MAKDGNHSVTSAHHGREGWKRWRQDNSKAEEKSTAVRIWIPVVKRILLSPETSVEECLLSASDDFKSFISELRPDPGSSWGYLVVPRISKSGVFRVGNHLVGEESKRDGAQPLLPVIGAHDRRLHPGYPDMDAGARALIPLDIDHAGRPLKQLDEIHDPYSRLLNEVGRLLEDYDYITKDSPPTRESRRTQAKGRVDNLRRKTIDVSPGISRAIELMIKAGNVELAREILEKLQLELAAEMEKFFPEGKVVGCGWHCNSGMPKKPGILHLDVWMHSTRHETRRLGVKETPTLVRTWESGGLDHCGPGPGICAWDRHMHALGAEMEKLAPGICYEVRKAIKYCEKRAVSRKRPGTANRDVQLHRKFDELMRRDLPAEFVEAGMDQYRDHLRKVYEGGDLKIIKAALDPEKFEKRKKVLEDVMQELAQREAALEKKLSQMASEGGELVSAKIRQEEGSRWVGQKFQSRKIGRKIGLLLADANATKIDADLAALQAEVLKENVGQIQASLDIDRENLHLRADELKEQKESLSWERDRDRSQASIDGLKDARRLVLGADATEPLSLTVEELGLVFQKEIRDHVDSKVIQKLDDVRQKLAGDEVSLPPVQSVEEVLKEISKGLATREEGAVLAGLKAALHLLNKGVETSAATGAEILKEITTTITKTVSDKLKGVLGRLRPNHESTATTPVELDEEIAAGEGAFRTKARESGLEEARRALLGADAPELENSNETTLRESIRIAVGQLKIDAKVEVAAVLIGEKFEVVIADGKDPVILVGLEFARLKEVEASAREVALNAPKANPTTKAGQALSTLRDLLKIDERLGGKGGYGDS